MKGAAGRFRPAADYSDHFIYHSSVIGHTGAVQNFGAGRLVSLQLPALSGVIGCVNFTFQSELSGKQHGAGGAIG